MPLLLHVPRAASLLLPCSLPFPCRRLLLLLLLSAACLTSLCALGRAASGSAGGRCCDWQRRQLLALIRLRPQLLHQLTRSRQGGHSGSLPPRSILGSCRAARGRHPCTRPGRRSGRHCGCSCSNSLFGFCRRRRRRATVCLLLPGRSRLLLLLLLL